MAVLRVLIVEDSEEDAELIVLELERAGYQVVHKRIQNREQMLESLREQDWDLVLSDYRMPGFSGLEALDIWKQHGSDQPFIIVSGTIGEELAVEAMKAGAHDYVLKRNISRLGPVVDRALRDVDERRLRREAEESLRRALELLQRTLNSQRDAVLVLDIHDPPSILEANPAATEVFGYSREELVGQPVGILHVDEARYEEFRSIVLRELRERGYSQLKFSMRRKDQSVFPSEHVVTPILGDGGVQSGYVSVVRDVSSREAAEKALRESHELFRLTVESTGDGIAVVALDGHVLHTNSAFVQMWAVPLSVLEKGEGGLLSHMTRELGSDGGPMPEAWTPLSPNSLDPWRGTFRFDDGRTYEGYRAPVVREGTPIAQLWTFHDITQLKRAQESAGLYLDLMCHDIRNRLQAISMTVDLIDMLFGSTDISLHLTQIQDDIAKCAGLIAKAKQTERLEDAPIRLTSLPQAIRDSTGLLLAQHRDVTVELCLGNSEALIEANEHLALLLAQLMQNAVIHNHRETKTIWVRLEEDDKRYELSMADNGPGIPDASKQSLFDGSRRYGGIGLHIVHQLMNSYGGRVAVRDRVAGDPSQGADFQLSFPKPHRHQVDSADGAPR